ncbi:MAG: hypothetical protein P3B98_13155, partial [Gemmatimonadota bacterium]|nr:hypothetical protein [Gemmatimonadota bacterium]
PGVVQLPDSVVIRAGNSSAQLEWTGLTAGTTVVDLTAPGFSPDSVVLTVLPPALSMSTRSLNVSLNAAYPGDVYVYATDSTRSCNHCTSRATPLTITASSSNPSVLVPSNATYTILARQSYTPVHFARLGAGSAYIRYSAAGYMSDSILVTVDGTLPFVSWAGSSATVGEGQFLTPYLSLSGVHPAQQTAAAFTLTSSNPAVATASGSVTLGAGSGSTESFRVAGHTAGIADIGWSAAGYTVGAMTVTVTTPKIRHNNPCCLVAPGNAQYFQVFVADAGLTLHPRSSDLVVTLTSSDTTVLKPTQATVTISTGNQSTYAYVQPRGAGTAMLILTAPGHTPDTLTLTVTGSAASSPRINVANSMVTLGRRQYQEMSVPRVGDFPAARFSIAKRGTATVLSDTAFNLSQGTSSTPWFRISALATGTDTLIFTAPGHIADTLLVRVTTPRLSVASNSGAILQNYPYGYLQVSLTDSLGNSHSSMDTLRLGISASDSNVTRLADRDVMILPDGYYFYGTIQFTGPGTSAFTVRDLAGNYPSVTSGTVTVTQPVLRHSFSINNPLTIGMRQRTEEWEAYVYTDYAVLVPTWIKLRPSAPGLVTVPDSVLMPAGDNYAQYSVIGRDTVGGLQLTATAPGFASAIAGISVSRPGFVVDDEYVYSADRGRSLEVVAVETDRYYSREVTEAVRVALSSDRPGVAAPDSVAITIPAGTSSSDVARINVSGIGRATITASDTRTSFQRYVAGSGDVTVEQAYIGPANTVLRLAPGQRAWYTVQTNFYDPDEVLVTVTGVGGHTNRTGTSTDTIPANEYYTYRSIVGTSYGVDTLTLTAPGFMSGRVVAEVSSGILAMSGSLPNLLKVGDSYSTYFYLRTPTGSGAESAGVTTVTLGATNGVWDNGAGPITTVNVADGQGYAAVTFKATAVGTATFTLSAPGYLSKTFTVQVLP